MALFAVFHAEAFRKSFISPHDVSKKDPSFLVVEFGWCFFGSFESFDPLVLFVLLWVRVLPVIVRL
jgi:hypothetical protein